MKVFSKFHGHVKNHWLTIILSVLIGVMFGLLIQARGTKAAKSLEATPIRNPDSNYPLINSLLGYDNPEATELGHLTTFKSNLSELINQEINQGNATKISVYFRDLNLGRWVAVNGEEQYSPASLLKVPVMIAYYHISESKPEVLNKKIIFTGKNDIDKEQSIKPEQSLHVGNTYTVNQLIDNMITYSDNDSLQLLVSNVDSDVFSRLFTDMNIPLPANLGVQDFISVKNYALFFRVLYASTYLDHFNSEKALKLLSDSTFKNGLVSDIPDSIVVAHKFGERTFFDKTSNAVLGNEFHDCGIIYYPNNPYLLCVMTKGDDLNKLQTSVSDLSKMVYARAQRVYK